MNYYRAIAGKCQIILRIFVDSAMGENRRDSEKRLANRRGFVYNKLQYCNIFMIADSRRKERKACKHGKRSPAAC